jgi:hypothetical protein
MILTLAWEKKRQFFSPKIGRNRWKLWSKHRRRSANFCAEKWAKSLKILIETSTFGQFFASLGLQPNAASQPAMQKKQDLVSFLTNPAEVRGGIGSWVARWYSFIPKIQIFGRPRSGEFLFSLGSFGIFYRHLVFLLVYFEYSVVSVYIFPRWVICTQKNPATLIGSHAGSFCNS